MNIKITSSFFVLTLLIVTIQSCEDNKLPEPNAIDCDGFRTVSFDLDIEPIISANCAIVGDGGCHNGGNGADRDWRVLSNLQAHKDEVDRRVRLPVSAADHMPRIGSISDEQIKLLVCWVRQGALDN